MRSENLEREELIREVARLNRNLSNRLKNVSKIPPEYRLKNDALSKYNELQDKTDKKPKEMSDKELRTYYRDLKYISSLKTSTVKGAENAALNFKDLERKLEISSSVLRDEIWELYGKLYEANPAVVEKFKYNIFDLINTQVLDSYKPTDIYLDEIINALQKAYGETGSYTSNEFDRVFKRELGNIGEFSYIDTDSIFGDW